MIVEGVLPHRGELALSDVLTRLRRVPPCAPFDPLLVEFVANLSKALTLGPELRAYPEIIALGHWARKASVLSYQRDFEALCQGGVRLMPRGLVFHVPPANVDTLFMYSWLLSLLVGNTNLIRLSSRESPQVEIVCERLGRLLAEPRFAPVRDAVAIVRYGHDAAIGAQISESADLRVVWGGDATVQAMRELPLAPSGRELSFGDRFSFSVVDARAYADATEDVRERLAERFFNDAMWFDQAGCSSPRLVVFCGEPGPSERVSAAFFDTLQRVITRRTHRVEPGHSLAKLSFSYELAFEGRLRGADRLSSELTVLTLRSLRDFERHGHPGAGLFFVAYIEQLEELVDFVRRQDQTLGHFGFASEELEVLATSLRGRGVDRMVPIGQALEFNRFWDGYDLLQELTRRVYVSG